MSDWERYVKSVRYYNKEEFIPRRDIRNTINSLIYAGTEIKDKAEKWGKAHGGVYDDEMPFTPERISLVMNFVNDHFPDFDTSKEFEDMITEYTDWETELTEAEDKLKSIVKIVGLWNGYQYEGHPELHLEIQQLTGDILKILKS